jgi:hypothetical protein
VIPAPPCDRHDHKQSEDGQNPEDNGDLQVLDTAEIISQATQRYADISLTRESVVLMDRLVAA